MKRVLTTVVLSWLLAAASGCCCPGPFLHAVGNHVFGPWHCGHRYHGGCGNDCGCGCGRQDDCCDAPHGNGCGCGGAQFVGGGGYGPGHGYCGDMYSAAAGGCGSCGGCGGCGDCPWYNTGCNSCCGCWGCGDVYLTDLFHPICDPCWRGGHGHHGRYGGGCQGGCDSCGSPGYADYGYGGGSPCGGVCNDCGGGPYASAPQRGAWMADGSSIPGQYMAQGPQAPCAAQRPYAAPNRSMTAQAMRGPWETATPPRSQWAMNREYVVSQPKVVDDRVVQSRPKAPAAKKTVQATPETTER